MAKRHDVHPFKKTAGIQQMFWATFITVADQLGVSDKDLEILGVPGAPVVRKMVEVFVKNKNTVWQGLRALVDYGLTLEEMITTGRYDWWSHDITAERFQVGGKGQQEVWIELLHYGKNMSSDAVLADMDARGYRPAKIEELLALGAQHPDEQRKYPIPGLGSSCQLFGDRYVPSLDLNGDGRDLILDYNDREWGGYCRFGAVRKS